MQYYNIRSTKFRYSIAQVKLIRGILPRLDLHPRFHLANTPPSITPTIPPHPIDYVFYRSAVFFMLE